MEIMKKLLLILLTLTVNYAFAQSEKLENKKMAEFFVTHYNNDDYQLIFDLFSKEMQQALPLEKTLDFLKGLKFQAGDIREQEFVKYEQSSYASYKTTFKRAVFAVNISVNDNSEINGLLVKPFVEEVVAMPVVNEMSLMGNVISEKQSELIFDLVKDFPNQTQLAIALIRYGEVSYYGIKRAADVVSTVDNHKSVFEIGSISKVFTSTLLACLIQEKKIKLTDNINDYLDFPIHNDVKISFKQLSTHTAGLHALPSNLDFTKVDIANPYKAYHKADLEEYLTKSLEQGLDMIGEYHYSNLGAGTIGYAVSEIEGSGFGELLKKKIFEKFKMPHSTIFHDQIKGTLVKGLDANGKEVSNWEFSVLVGAGGILSNVDDLSTFALAQFDPSNKALALTRQKTIAVNDNMNMGLGWHILKSKAGDEWHWHNGGTGGYSSSMTLDVNRKNGIIILSNVSGLSPRMGNIDKLGHGLLESLVE